MAGRFPPSYYTAMGMPMPRDRWYVYLIRHGATHLNSASVSDERIRGWSEAPLTVSGRREAKLAGDSLKEKGIKKIYTSDLPRAVETAEIIGGLLDVPVKQVRGLRPWDMGDLTGKLTSDAEPLIRIFAESAPEESIPEGESFNSFKKRALSFVRSKIGEEGIVFVSHSGVEQLLRGWKSKGEPSDLSVSTRVALARPAAPGSVQRLSFFRVGSE